MDDVTRDLALGRSQEALPDLQATISRARAGLARPSSVVHGAGRLWDRELTLDWLEKSYAHHDYWELFINVDPEYGWVRSEPRFQPLVHKLGVN